MPYFSKLYAWYIVRDGCQTSDGESADKCTSFTPTSDLTTRQQTHRGTASGLPVNYCTRRQRWKLSLESEPSVILVLLPGTVCRTSLGLNRTLKISRNFLKHIFLRRHFNIVFIVFSHAYEMSAGLFSRWTISPHDNDDDDDESYITSFKQTKYQKHDSLHSAKQPFRSTDPENMLRPLESQIIL